MYNNSIANNILNLIKENKSFCFDYPDLNIYSRQYYKNILLNIFDNSIVPYSYVFGDFDKLSDINSNLGKSAGDMALHNALKIIQRSLPKSTTISRIAGDEFSFILPKALKHETELYLQDIHKNLDIFKHYTNGITITLACEDSSKDTSSNLENITEQEVNNLKMKRKKNSDLLNLEQSSDDINLATYDDSENWSSINNSIINAVKNHYSDLRLSDNFTYNLEDYHQESMYIINEIGKMLELRSNNPYIDNSSSVNSQNYYFSYEDAILLNDLFSKKDCSEYLSNFSEDELQHIYECCNNLSDILVRNPLSNLFSKNYLKSELLEKLCHSDSNYKATYFSSLGIKASNTAYGHDYTDFRISSTAKKLREILKDYTSYNNNKFEFNPSDNFLIDQGGGNFVLITNASNSLSNSQLEEILSRTNLNDILPSFKLEGMNSDILPKDNSKIMLESIRILKNRCNYKKDRLRHRYLDSQTNIDAFESEFCNCVDSYWSGISNPSDIQNKKRFLTNIFTALTNEVTNYSQKNNKSNFDYYEKE